MKQKHIYINLCVKKKYLKSIVKKKEKKKKNWNIWKNTKHLLKKYVFLSETNSCKSVTGDMKDNKTKNKY